jgi:predicted GIY-YIG superfamily endonuclease
MIAVYLIHFMQPYKHAQHYLGSTDDLSTRLLRHHAGNGSRLMSVITKAGIKWVLARAWYFDTVHEARQQEKIYKAAQHNKRLCPICNNADLSTISLENIQEIEYER